MKSYYYIILIGVFALNRSMQAQAPPKLTDANKILDNVIAEFEKIKDFSANVRAEVKMERVQIPPMNAVFYFKQPDKIHFSSQGFLLVPREGVSLNPASLREHYDATIVYDKKEKDDGLYKLQLAAKEKETHLRQLYVWVDPSNWTIVRTETIPYEGRTLTTTFKYDLQQGSFWLPTLTTVLFGSTLAKVQDTSRASQSSAGEIGQMQQGIPRSGSLTILYSHYQVNKGVPDSLFVNKSQ